MRKSPGLTTTRDKQFVTGYKSGGDTMVSPFVVVQLGVVYLVLVCEAGHR